MEDNFHEHGQDSLIENMDTIHIRMNNSEYGYYPLLIHYISKIQVTIFKDTELRVTTGGYNDTKSG